MAGFDVTNPGDSDIVSQFPANERDQRSAVSSAFGLEHDSAGAGRHKLPVGNTSARDALSGINNGTLFVNSSAGTGNFVLTVWSSTTSAWESTAGSAAVLQTATSAEMVALTVSANRNMSPYLVGVALSANPAIVAATSAQVLDASSTAVFTSPGRQHSHPSASKAWCLMIPGSDTISASYNVATVSTTATGVHKITWTTAFPGTNYVCVGNITSGAGASTVNLLTKTAAAVTFQAFDGNNVAQNFSELHVVAYGDL